MKNFALIGVGGYIAPRHLGAIRHVGGNLVAAVDRHDSVGIMDSHFPDATFFTDFEKFDTYIAERRSNGQKLDYVSICSPNHLHLAHCSFGLRNDADVICEKPLVLNPADLDALERLERETGRSVSSILQLRLHDEVIKLKERFANSGKRHSVDLTYITSRGSWYHTSWKGDVARSGGVASNIGVHFFDMLAFLFGPVRSQVAHLRDDHRAGGFIEFENADVRWFLSIDRNDLPESVQGKKTTFRAIEIDGVDAEFSEGFTELHNRSYAEVLAGRGFGLAAVRPSIETVSAFRTLPIQRDRGEVHPVAKRYGG